MEWTCTCTKAVWCENFPLVYVLMSLSYHLSCTCGLSACVTAQGFQLVRPAADGGPRRYMAWRASLSQ